LVEIKEVLTNRSLNAFIKFPDSLYKNSQYHVTPLHSIERNTLNKKKNPSFDWPCPTSIRLVSQAHASCEILLYIETF